MTTALTHSSRGPNSTSRNILILIGVFKLIKAALLIMAAAVALMLRNRDAVARLRDWISGLALSPDRRLVGDWIANRILNLNVRTLTEVAIGAALYAGLFTTEGLGLILNKAWAEWLAVFTTAGLIPFEVNEIVRRHSLPGAVILVLNVAIVIYLIVRVRARMEEHRLHHAASPHHAATSTATGAATASPTPTQTPPAPPHPHAGSYAPDTSSPRSVDAASAPQ